MKYKIFTIILIGTILTIIISKIPTKEKTNFMSLGDSLSLGYNAYNIIGYDYNDYLKEYLTKNNNLKNFYHFNELDETTHSLLEKINNNIEIKKIKIKQAIKDSDIITIFLGMDELNNYAKKKYLSSTKINSYLENYENILKNITKLNKNKIYLISLYQTIYLKEEKIKTINELLKNLSHKYNITYVDIENISKNPEFFDKKNNYYLNYKGHNYIYNEILKLNNKKTFLNLSENDQKI